MERNHNEQLITMSREMYENLLGAAQYQDHYTVKHIEKHVRKFNPFMQAPHQARIRKQESRRSEMIRSTRKYYNEHHGKIVYAKVDMGNCKKGDDPVFMPVRMLRIAKDRRLVVAECMIDPDSKHKRTESVSTDGFVTEIPEGYIRGVSWYSNYLVKENGPYDIREEVARRKEFDRQLREENETRLVEKRLEQRAAEPGDVEVD